MPAIEVTRSKAPPTTEAIPLVPTLPTAAWKGGSWKTSLAVAIAQRLAYTGEEVALVSVDRQRDTMDRLGLAPGVGTTRLSCGSGALTVADLDGAKIQSVLYDDGPSTHGLGSPSMIIVDMPPQKRGGMLPGTFTVVPLVDINAIKNSTTMLLEAPKNSELFLIKVGMESLTTITPEDLATELKKWRIKVKGMEEALRRDLHWLTHPIPRSKEIALAHEKGGSIWTLPPDEDVLMFHDAIETICKVFWQRVYPNDPLPPMPRLTAKRRTHIPGWP